MANLSKIYSDIDFTFTKKPVTGDVALSYDTQAVIRSIRNLLLTRNYERPFNPDLGSNLDGLLFELISPLTATVIEREIQTLVENYEPRAKVDDVFVTSLDDDHALTATIVFHIINKQEPITLEIVLNRIR